MRVQTRSQDIPVHVTFSLLGTVPSVVGPQLVHSLQPSLFLLMLFPGQRQRNYTASGYHTTSYNSVLGTFTSQYFSFIYMYMCVYVYSGLSHQNITSLRAGTFSFWFSDLALSLFTVPGSQQCVNEYLLSGYILSSSPCSGCELKAKFLKLRPFS